MGRLGRLALMELQALCDSCGNLTLGEVEVAAFRNLQSECNPGSRAANHQCCTSREVHLCVH